MLGMITVSVLYPKTADSRFDYDYYLGTHIPLVKARWTSTGLDRVDLLRAAATLDGSAPAYELIGLLTFTSLEAAGQSIAAHGAEIIDDIPNFTNVQPVVQINTPVHE